MDAFRFDRFTRALTTVPSRRLVLQGLVAAVLGLAPGSPLGAVHARKRKKTVKRNEFGCVNVAATSASATISAARASAGARRVRRSVGPTTPTRVHPVKPMPSARLAARSSAASPAPAVPVPATRRRETPGSALGSSRASHAQRMRTAAPSVARAALAPPASGARDAWRARRAEVPMSARECLAPKAPLAACMAGVPRGPAPGTSAGPGGWRRGCHGAGAGRHGTPACRQLHRKRREPLQCNQFGDVNVCGKCRGRGAALRRR